MAKSVRTPVSALQELLDEYQLTSYGLAKAINLSVSAVRQITTGKSKVSVPTAMRLAKFFGQAPEYWLDLQREADLSEAKRDEELQAVLKDIVKAKKPKPETKAKAGRKPASKRATQEPETIT